MKTRIMLFILVLVILISVSVLASADIKPPAEVNQEGNCVIFGAYDQWDLGVEGLEYVENGDEPIEWIVLRQDGTKLFLVSKYPLDYQQYNSIKSSYTWKSSSIRRWLNKTFINQAFTEEEQKAILTVDVTTGLETFEKGWSAGKRETTQDKIFLLSHSEMRFLKDDKVEINRYLSMVGGTIFKEDNSWWLRSQGKNENEACYVGHGKNESGWLTDWRCIRPAMWIDYSLLIGIIRDMLSQNGQKSYMMKESIKKHIP